MPPDVPDGQDSTDVYSGDMRIAGDLSDIIVVKQMGIRPVSTKTMKFTPDGDFEADFIKPDKGIDLKRTPSRPCQSTQARSTR